MPETSTPETQPHHTGPTGPRTTEGKLISRMNALKHGLASRQLIIEGESLAEFESLEGALLEEHAPTTPTETLLVKEIAKCYWLKDRAIRFQAIAFNISAPHLAKMAAPLDLSVLLRYQTANERGFYKALKNLRDGRAAAVAHPRVLQAQQKEGKQFVSQKPEPVPDPPNNLFKNLPALDKIDLQIQRLAAALEESERTGEDPFAIELRMLQESA